MNKRAVCVGIDRYGHPNVPALRGCVNDARAWAELLVTSFDFPEKNVVFLADRDATKKQVLKGLNEMIAESSSGDILVFINASHGTHEVDETESEDEDDGLDEVLCTYDYGDEILIDDELRAAIRTVPSGVHLTVISDSCHSGTLTRDIFVGLPTLALPEIDLAQRTFDPTIVGRKGYDPARNSEPSVEKALSKVADAKMDEFPESEMTELLLSGCRADQTSKERWFDGGYHGAMSQCALQAIRESEDQMTYRELHKKLLPMLKAASISDQDPQLEGSDAFKDRKLFS
jgi:metacaspase-1